MLGMDESKNIYDLVNCILQFALAALAWAAIIVTRRQVPGTTKAKFKICRGFVVVREDDENSVALQVDIVNLGMASIYVEELGVALRKRFRRKRKLIALPGELGGKKLKPGNPIKQSFLYSHDEIKEMIDDRCHEKTKVCIYVKYHLGEIYYSREESFCTFDFAFDRVNKAALGANKEMERIKSKCR